MIQELRLHTSNAAGTSMIPGWETKTPHAVRCGQKKIKMLKNLIQCSYSPVQLQAETWADVKVIAPL